MMSGYVQARSKAEAEDNRAGMVLQIRGVNTTVSRSSNTLVVWWWHVPAQVVPGFRPPPRWNVQGSEPIISSSISTDEILENVIMGARVHFVRVHFVHDAIKTNS